MRSLNRRACVGLQELTPGLAKKKPPRAEAVKLPKESLLQYCFTACYLLLFAAARDGADHDEAAQQHGVGFRFRNRRHDT